MRKISCLLLPLLIAMSSAAFAQSINVSLEASTDDDIGRQLAYQIRQKFAKSPLMTYVSNDKVSSIRVRLTTLNPDDGPTQTYTVYSAVVVLHPSNDGLESYLTSKVGTCGRQKIEQCANTMIGEVDEWAEILRKSNK